MWGKKDQTDWITISIMLIRAEVFFLMITEYAIQAVMMSLCCFSAGLSDILWKIWCSLHGSSANKEWWGFLYLCVKVIPLACTRRCSCHTSHTHCIYCICTAVSFAHSILLGLPILWWLMYGHGMGNGMNIHGIGDVANSKRHLLIIPKVQLRLCIARRSATALARYPQKLGKVFCG